MEVRQTNRHLVVPSGPAIPTCRVVYICKSYPLCPPAHTQTTGIPLNVYKTRRGTDSPRVPRRAEPRVRRCTAGVLGTLQVKHANAHRHHWPLAMTGDSKPPKLAEGHTQARCQDARLRQKKKREDFSNSTSTSIVVWQHAIWDHRRADGGSHQHLVRSAEQTMGGHSLRTQSQRKKGALVRLSERDDRNGQGGCGLLHAFKPHKKKKTPPRPAW